MNAIDFLIKEHDNVRKMLRDIKEDAHHYESQRREFEKLSKVLLRHETMEHEVWYPCFKNKIPSKVKHLVREENMAEMAIKKLDTFKTEEAWEEHFIKFKRDVENHAREEERDLFPEVQKILSEKELEGIGRKMDMFKKRYLM